MKKRIFSTLLALCMLLCLMPTAAFAEDSTETPPVCSCETACTADNMNKECPVCGAENAIPQNCGQYIPVEDRTGENGSTEGADDPNGPTELSAADQVQAMIDGLPNAEEITEDNAEEVKAQLEAIDEAKEKLSDEEIDELDMTRYAEAAAALGALAAPMLLANDSPDEQFSLAPGGTYYFDLSGENIPGTANGSLPDASLHYVPFTYAGTVNAYKLTSAMATTEEYAEQNKYDHSLFIADFAVTNDVSWDALNGAGLIFGKDYAAGGVDYTLRAPSVGSKSTSSGESKRGTPQSNEWDRILDKGNGYIKNWSETSSWGQDTNLSLTSTRGVRGYSSARRWVYSAAGHSSSRLGFRPVLEVLNPDTLDSDGLKVVTLDLGGGTLGNSSGNIQIIVKTGSEFTAPASDGMTRPDGNTGSYFMWLGSDGKLYAPGASVPADVTKLTAQFALSEQFTLTPGGTYYFDLSAMGIPGTVNDALPDNTLHYVPFTYAGTVDAYKLMSEMATTEEYAQREKYPHSLFVADYAVTHKVNWNNLDTASLIFGKNYASGGVDYTLRAPSCGSGFTGSDDSERGTPQSNEWDAVLDKNSGYVKNWNDIYSWGQDTSSYESWYRAVRGYSSARRWLHSYATSSYSNHGFRPVLEVRNPNTLGSGGLKVVTLDLGGGTLGNSSEDIQIIVKTGSEFTAPASDGLTRPDGNTGSYFMWLGSDGKLYAPGAIVPAEVTNLTAQFALSEQFSLTPGGTYYFDLSDEEIPGTVNTGNEDGAVSLPDTSLHYVPFTYAGTIEAYKLTSAIATTEEYAQQNKYPHSLFIADYNVTHTVSWNDLDTASLIFGKNYASGGVDYTLRAPSVGSNFTGSYDSQRGVPQSNEWDTMLNKNSGYIQNWNKMYSWGQDAYSADESRRAVRGCNSARYWNYYTAARSYPFVGFRPVLEVLNADTLGSGGLKVVTLDLNGGKLGGSSDAIQIIVKNGSKFTAPASGGLTRPAGDTGSYFMWLDSNGNSYAPGASVPADVTALTVQWTAPTYTVTLHTNDGTINSGNVTEYTYGVGATLPTDVTRTGYTFKGWYDNENLTGSPVTAISNTETGNKEYWAKWEINQYTVTFKPKNGEADITITQDYGTPITAPTLTREGYTFTGWDRDIPATMPAENMTVTAKWKVNQYTITFDTNGGSEITPITQDYGTAITAPANPTREGYTFIGWDKAIPATMPAENMTITAKWKVNQYTITFDSNGGSEIAPITQDYGTAITAPADPIREGYTFIGWDKAIPATMPAENLTITAQWRDIAVPTGEIKITENGWKSFFNTITFDLFFKDTQTVTVTAADNSSEAVKIEYLLSNKALTESELAGMTFTTYSAPFSINADNEYVIYAKLTDTSGNVAYINTNGIVLDATVPGISGIADGKTYCAAQTVTVTEKYISTVKVNGTEVSLDKNSQFALSPASGEQTIVVTDKAGNETRVTVTVNNGHTYEWQSENGQYWQKCKFCNHETAKKDIPTINISGADKVCRTQDYKFSFTLPEGATGAACGYEFIGLGGAPLTPTVENGLYSGIIKASTYPATENSFKLIVSAKTADGFAFSAEKKVTIQNEHTGGTATCKDKAICEVCGESYGKLDPNNHANLKHIDAKAATKTSEGNIEYWYCDGCNKYYKDAKATQEITKAQTVTAKLPPKITAGDGATTTQGEKKELSFTSDASFADFLRVELDGTTLDEKNYTKKEGSTIITLNRDFVATLSVGEHTLAIVSQSGTATAKFTVKAKPAETATPQPTVTPQPTAQPQPTVQPVSPLPRTGDTANPALWFALLIVSGSALAVIFVLRRKGNRK